MRPLTLTMAWRRTGDKPLSEPWLVVFIDAYMRHLASRSQYTQISGYVWYTLIICDTHSVDKSISIKIDKFEDYISHDELIYPKIILPYPFVDFFFS